MAYQHIVTEQKENVGWIELHRPRALNALCDALMDELGEAIAAYDGDDAVGAIVLTGSDKAFAAGADIAEMQAKTYPQVLAEDFITRNWQGAARARTPIIAAVAGYALGGGCELAMMCDMIVAADNAQFGQPEIRLGVMPGAGGTQRLTRLVGKAKAMDMCLTGRMMDAAEAERAGLVSRVVPLKELRAEVQRIAETIAALSRPAVHSTKKSVQQAYESGLAAGIEYERRMFHALFALEDRSEGMDAFLKKRTPRFRHR